MSRVIERSRVSSPVRKVRIFGEMVSLLLARNEVAIAERLERLWNEIIGAHLVSLFCTYTQFDSGYATLPDTITKLHSHNLASWFPDVLAIIRKRIFLNLSRRGFGGTVKLESKVVEVAIR